jgi:CheY-like chemotaxis protein
VKNLQQVEVLLVEDSAYDAEMTLRTLARNKIFINVHWVKDGADALDFMFCDGAYSHRDSTNKLKLVLLDLDIPKVDGIEVLRRLRADARTRATPVVIMTSSNEVRDTVESDKLGVNSYITKPVQFEAFLDTVSKIGLYWILGVPDSPAPKADDPS